ncbi:MAG TPA: type 1 glutamine amidotransferase domain-containing protein [Caulobacteraceae bacterium]|jgi:protease I
MPRSLEGKKVAILATDGFEQAELLAPREALQGAGAEVEIISPKGGEIQGFDHLKPDKTVRVDKTLDEARADDYDAIILPGGANNPDHLRIDNQALAFVRQFFEAGKPAGVICHAPWVLINAGLAEGRTLTSFKTIRQDLKNAGAHVVDQEVVVDRGLVTSRGPDDLPAFCAKLIEEIGEGRHHGQGEAAR